MKHLTKKDFAFILESLTYSKKTFQEYDRYPDENFRKQQVAKVDEVMSKVKQELAAWND